MDTIPSIQDIHKTCIESKAKSNDDEDEQMEKIFEGDENADEEAKLRRITGRSDDGTTPSTSASREGHRWTSGFEESDVGRPSTPQNIEGDPKYMANTDNEEALYSTPSFPHTHHRLKLHHHHHHHKRKRSKSTSATEPNTSSGTTLQQPKQSDVASSTDGIVVKLNDEMPSLDEKSMKPAPAQSTSVTGTKPPHISVDLSPPTSSLPSICVVDMSGDAATKQDGNPRQESPTQKQSAGDIKNGGSPSLKKKSSSPFSSPKSPVRKFFAKSSNPNISISDAEGVTTMEDNGGGWRKALPKFLAGRTQSKEQRLKDYGATSGDEGHQQVPLMTEQDKSHLKPCLRSVESDLLSSDDEAKQRSKVKFRVGSDTETEHGPKEEKQKARSKRRRRRDTPHEYQRHPGSQHQLSQYYSVEPTTPDEAIHLLGHDLDDLTSHRFEDAAARRRPRVRTRNSACSVITFSTRGDPDRKKHQTTTFFRSRSSMKKSFDHKPHDVFVELSELKQTVYGPEWKETARWIKYEEDVEGVDANRWGKPHVAFLNFHSLFSLRKGLDRGAVLLDLEETDLQGISTRVVEYMVANDQLPADQKEAVINTLLLKHRHVNENQFAIARRESRTTLDDDGKPVTVTVNESASTGNLRQNLRASFKRAGVNKVFSAHSIRRHSSFDTSAPLGRSPSSGSFRERLFSVRKPGLENESSYNPETGEGFQISETMHNADLMKKLPDGTEATAVLVGAVDFLKSPTIAFVRLAEGVMMDNLVEVPIPVRFLFILLGPYHGEMDYHEVGRSISTLMSDKHFHEVAYKAHSRGQLLSAINEFLNASIVLPPAELANTDLIPVDQIREKAHEMARRKESLRQKRIQSDSQSEAPTEVVVQQPRATIRHPKKPPARNPLVRIGKPFAGVVNDLKARMPLYLSDLRDGLNPQVLATIIFIFFASLSPAITFGGMYADKTDKRIGVGETLLVTCINGVIISLFSCQPLLIIGATGPLMIFDLALFSFTKSQGMEYLPPRVWVAIWMTVIVLIISAFELIVYIRYLTRFTEEIFSTLVCVIFIYGAFDKLAHIFMEHPLIKEYCYGDENSTQMTTTELAITNTTAYSFETWENNTSSLYYNTSANDNINGTIVNGELFNGTNADGEIVDFAAQPQPNTALLSLILMIGTFIIAFKLKKFRNSKYLGRPIRRALGDFGVPIAITLMVLLDFLIEDTYTDKLTMPAGIQPSDPEYRGWFINPFGIKEAIPTWVIFATAPASFLLLILICIEANICQLILAKPERNLKKGTGFHWDLIVVCIMNVICGVLGAPFMTPAVVRTVSHASALTVIDTKVAPGESPKVVGAHEQRVSSLCVSALVGLAIFASPVLNMIPNAVLYGVFLYMGISATAGIQFLDRFILFFVPVKHHPNTPYVKQVRTRKMHLFTLVQVAMFAVLWAVKQSPLALCFPFVLLMLVPIRSLLLPFGWSNTELVALDGGGKPDENDDEEPDFYEQSHQLGNEIKHEHNN